VQYMLPLSTAPPSQKSSRAPSPIPGPTYDAMEGQFAPSQPAPGQFSWFFGL